MSQDPPNPAQSEHPPADLLPVIEDDPDDVVERLLKKIGTGKYQYIAFFILGFTVLGEAAEIISLAILNYVLMDVVWFESMTNMKWMGTCVFFGVFIGASTIGLFADRYGRKGPFIFAAIGIFVSGIMSALSPNFAFLLSTRFLFGVVAGMLYPLAVTLVAEITDKIARGHFWIIFNLWSTTGVVVGLTISYFLGATNPGSNGWRPLLAWCCVPCLVGGILFWIFLLDSGRFMMLKKPDEGLKILNEMYKENHEGQELVLESRDTEEVKDWAEHLKKQVKPVSLEELFTKENWRITVCSWISWTAMAFINSGILYTLPLITAELNNENLENPNINYQELYIAALADFPSLLLAYILINNDRFGRKYSSILCFVGATISCFGARFSSTGFIYFIFGCSFFMKAGSVLVYLMTTELYSTTCRVTGIGSASACARVGTMIMPWILLNNFTDPTTPFLYFGILGVVAIVALSFLPDTKGRNMDRFVEEGDENEKERLVEN